MRPQPDIGSVTYITERLRNSSCFARDISNSLERIRVRIDDRVTGGPSWVSSDLFDIEGKAENVDSVTSAQLFSMLRQLLIDRFHLQFHKEQREIKGYALVVGKNGPKMPPGTGDSHTVGGGPWRGVSATNADMTLFAWHLGLSVMRAPVIDKTGLDGGYTFTLPVTSDFSPSSPSIFTALQEELGLRLEPTNVPVDVIVIDHAEKPSEN